MKMGAKWWPFDTGLNMLTHLALVPHICVSEQGGSDNGLWTVLRQAIIWTDTDLFLIGPLGTNLGDILIKIKKLFIHKNAFENSACEEVAIL